MGVDLVGTSSLRFISRSCVNRHNDALRTELGRKVAYEFNALDGRSVDGDLVRSCTQETHRVGDRAHSAPDREGYEHLLRRSGDDVDHCRALFCRGGDVEKDDLVGPFLVVSERELCGVTRVAESLEPHALYDPAAFHVEARDHSHRSHAAIASPRSSEPLARALPTTTPASRRFSPPGRSTDNAASAARSPADRTPPEAMTG